MFENIHEILQRTRQVSAILDETSATQEALQIVNHQLEPSSKMLRDLKKLVESIKELQTEMRDGEFDYYRIIAELLVDVQGQMARFDAYGAIPQVIAIRERISSIEYELRGKIQWIFREIGPLVTADPGGEQEGAPAPPPRASSSSSSSSVDVDSLSQTYLVIDALGVKFRKDLLDRFAQLQLIPYEKAFKVRSSV